VSTPPPFTGEAAVRRATETSSFAVSSLPVLNDDVTDAGFASLGLPERLVERLARDGITTPFPIQAATVPDALAGRNVLGRGQTGSGKTLAFGLPVLARLAGGRSASRKPRAIVLVPTRELAMQVHDGLEPLAHVVGVRIKLVAGGLPYFKQIQALERGVDVLVATPGRLTDLVERGACDLSDVEVTVLDEADHMCDMGFLPAVSALLDLMPKTGQRLLFSATLDGDVDSLVRRYISDPVTHSTDEAQASVTTMDHHVWLVKPNHKAPLTAALAAREGRTVVFVRTKLGADRVAGQLRQQGVRAAALHGGLGQGQRNRTLGAFKDGHVPVLVATDVAARGIHVDDVSLVVQVDPPADHKDYLHRAGRTARAGGKGTVITLALPHQRRTVERLTSAAGVDARPESVFPEGDALLAVTRGAVPSGVEVAEHELFPPKRPARTGRPHRPGQRRPGSGPRREGQFGGDRRDRGERGERGQGRGRSEYRGSRDARGNRTAS
jgi:superfamily II DNA/RNA helicase